MALTRLLGPGTEYTLRLRAARQLARQGPAILPSLRTALSTCSEICASDWPWWPQQYELCSRLLLHLSRQAEMPLEELVEQPAPDQSAGPVLWACVLGAAGQLPHEDHEALLCRGLASPWPTVRYAAAMSLATRARKIPLHTATIGHLLVHLDEVDTNGRSGAEPREAESSAHGYESLPAHIFAAFALLCSGERAGLEALLRSLDSLAPPQARKTATFLLATELPVPLALSHRSHLAAHLLLMLRDPDEGLAQHAALALSHIISPSMLPSLSALLDEDDPQTHIAVLTVLEEIAHHKLMRQAMRHQALSTRLLPLLKSASQDVRLHACYTLAVCGGEYATAVLGTTVLNRAHPAHRDAVESLRLLHGVLRAPLRKNVVRWLLRALLRSPEEVQVTALDSLKTMLWQAQTRRQKQAWHEMSQEILHDGTILHLVQDRSTRIRQCTLELLSVLDGQLAPLYDLPPLVRRLLHTDTDSTVRASAAFVYGRLAARWAIPDLIEALLDSDEEVARTALHMLGHLATPDDAIVLYVVGELARCGSCPLVRDARTVLKKLRQKGK